MRGTLEIGTGCIPAGDEIVRILTADLADTRATESQPARARVLVVDDERLIADTCAEILESAGLLARAAYDGRSALEAVAEFQPDYLLTDVLMPGMNGVELAIAVTKMLPAARILLFSGQAGISEILLQGHAQGYEFELLAKPMHPDKLVERFRKREN